MNHVYKICQSCGMPLRKDPEGGGSKSDGSRSLQYCSYCFRDGEFTHPDWTVLDMQYFVKQKAKEMGIPGFLAGFFAKGIPKLERWRKK